MNYMNKGKRTYSTKEKAAFHAVRGYAQAQKGKRMGLRTKKEQDSFKNGYKRVR